MSPKRLPWLSISALVLAASALIFSLFRIRIVLTHDTWTGIMASFIGAAATLIVGTQIYSSITTRREIKSTRKTIRKTRSMQAELKRQLEMCETRFKGNHLFSQALALRDSQQFSALNLTLGAIRFYLACKSYEDCKVCMNNCDLLLSDTKARIETVNHYGYDQNLDEVLEEIRQQKEFSLIQARFEKIVDERKRLVELVEAREARAGEVADNES